MQSDITLESDASKIFGKSEVTNQVESSMLIVCDKIDDGYSLVSNVKVDGNAYEKIRREEDRSEKEQRLQYIEKEEKLAEAKFLEINKQWEKIIKLQHPLDQYESTESHLGNQCRELLADKDRVIRKLKEVLKKADLKLLKDLQRQTSDLTLLLSTVSEQEKILKRAVLAQLSLIEKTIDKAAEETKEEFHKIWQDLDNEREENQARFMSEKVKSVITHYDEIANHENLLQEQDRSSRIRLDQDVQRIHRELQDLKAVCLLNIEKMDYSTHLLRKQAEESKLLKSQQDKTMLKIKSAAEDLKQMTHSYRNNGYKIRKLRNNLDKLYNSIITELEMRKFTDVHLKKFKQIWKFNKETADNLLQKILFMDRTIVERLFQLKWTTPENLYVKNILAKETKLMAVEGDLRMERMSVASRMSRSAVEPNEDILKHLLRILVDSSGFLMEEKLFELLKPHSHSERLLVQLSNVFDVLGIRNEDDVYHLYNHLEPYIECTVCQNQTNMHTEQNFHHSQIDMALVDGSPPPSYTTPSHSFIKNEEDEALLRLDTMIENRYKMTRDVVKEFTDPSAMRSDDASIESWNFDAAHRSIRLTGAKSETLSIKVKPKKSAAAARHVCRYLNHPLTISTSNLMKALQNLVCKLDEKKCSESPITLYDRLERLPPSQYSHIEEGDVVNFWSGYKTIFTMENERQWNAILIGLREYYDELKERHYLNTEVRKLKLDNLALEKVVSLQKVKKTENETRFYDQKNIYF
ncbi:hypothetical protein LSTR_LSTR002153 [Laodelphax striatellus]|uniref:Dynein regulatory complex protein 1 n=1 Tax=Laodelphax striatellus TaxID=195883 RepID=A0A482XRB3_LAOST|nr:hypothetical protein LSTR_LSTR002153 [Laodelphax striatellus]